MKTILLLSIILSSCQPNKPTTSSANNYQDTTLRGRVIDESGNGLTGVTVYNKDKHTGTLTDMDGYFTMTAKPGEAISISYMGYANNEFEVKSQGHTLLIDVQSGLIQQYFCCSSHIPDGNQHCEKKRQDLENNHPDDEVIKVKYQ